MILMSAFGSRDTKSFSQISTAMYFNNQQSREHGLMILTGTQEACLTITMQCNVYAKLLVCGANDCLSFFQQHLGAFGPLKLKETNALEKLHKQAVIIEQLITLCVTKMEVTSPDESKLY